MIKRLEALHSNVLDVLVEACGSPEEFGPWDRKIMNLIESEISHLEDKKSAGIERIAAERHRQIDVEGWTAEWDDQHESWELLRAAAGYADFAADLIENGSELANWDVPCDWPWADEWWKPSPDPARNMEKSGALTAAAIDRLERAKRMEADDG